MSLTKNHLKHNNDKKLISGMNVGSSSILVTFVLLCLVTFAALSYVSANSDYKLSRETSIRSQAYYEASSTAEHKLAEIEKTLAECFENSSSEEEYYDLVESSFGNHELIKCENKTSNLLLSYNISISEIQKLNVELIVNYPKNASSEFFTINKWQNSSSYSEENLTNESHQNLLF